MLDKTETDWQAAAAELDIEGRAFIDGRVTDALSGETRPCFNPSTGKKLADVANCGAEDAELAVGIARKIFDDGAWSAMAPSDRKMVLVRWAELIEEHADEIALLECLDVGKPISDTTGGDVPSAVRTIRWSGEAIDKVYDEISPTGPGSLALVQRLPLGVVTAIVPWNFPLSTTAWKLAPSLATGNSVILKPASNTPLTAIRIAGLAAEAGLPDGVLQVLPGPGGSLGRHLATHMDIDGLTFTGSTPVGKQLMEYSGQSNLKRTFLELGGKSPNIVFADADLKKAANSAAAAVFYNGGQTCTAGTRLIVEESIRDEFMEMVVDRARRWMPGNPLDPETRMGPMIDKGQFDTVAGYVAVGRNEGAELLFGGGQVLAESGGFFHEPTIFAGVTNDMRIAQEEIFGPVLSVVRADDYESALGMVNDHEYGNGPAIFTRDGDAARDFAQRVNIGMVGSNGPIPVPVAYHSFGGWKRSMFGDHHMNGAEGVRFYTKAKYVTSRWPSGIRAGAEFVMPELK